MPAKFIPIGEPAHDLERQAIRFLVDSLPDTYTIYGNAWLVDRNGSIFEIDAVVAAPHAIFVVEIKAHRGRIDGTDHDWYTPAPMPSPLKLNRLTAQILKNMLKRENYRAGQVWVEGLVFLSATTDVGVLGPASRDRLHTRRTILGALQDPALVQRLCGGRALPPTAEADKDLLRLLTGVQGGPKPVRRVREYEIAETLNHQETFTELLGRNTLSGAERVLRIYTVPLLASDAQRNKYAERARWEAQVLGRLGRIKGILSADPPFTDEAGMVLPLERFVGISLISWVERYGPEAQGKDKPRADLRARTNLWLKIAQTLEEAHLQGVVHRLLRPEVILVQDRPEPEQIRITGFDLAKQLTANATISVTSIGDDRLIYSAPEVVAAFSSAEPVSDQFSLGAILALLLTGRPLFDSTRQVMDARRMLRRVRDMAPRIPLSLDEIVDRMVQLRPTDRYPALAEAIRAVQASQNCQSAEPQLLLSEDPLLRIPMDADNLQAGTRVGTDYEVLGRLGQGGLSVVYAARHLVSGRTRALKIARTEESAEEALRGEYKVLAELDHPNIVKVIDLTKMVEGRLTLVMERVGSQTLRQWLAQNANPEPALQRRLAEDLLAGLDYLEQRAITHKDLKPDNLLVNEGHLTIIDFSLAAYPEDALYGGTALYRDPATARWTHDTDRYAAALCLFELYAGRHAFDGRVPEPGDAPAIQAEDIDPGGLAAFFQKALNPLPELRFPSTKAMRDAMLRALGEDVQTPAQPGPIEHLESVSPLGATSLSRRAINALARCQVHTAGELLALTSSQVRAIHALGNKTVSEILGFQETLRAQGVQPASTGAFSEEPPLVPELAYSPEPIQKLSLIPSLRSALEQAGLTTVGAVAALTHGELLEVPGIGRNKLTQVVSALRQFQDRNSAPANTSHTLDQFWERAGSPLTEAQRNAVDRVLGLTGEPMTQTEIASAQGRSQPQISLDLLKGLENLDRSALAEPGTALDETLDSFGGIARIDEVAKRFERFWPAGMVTGSGLIRLLVRISPGRVHLLDLEGTAAPLLAHPMFDRDTLRAFVAEAIHLAERWPPLEPETVRRSLSTLMPHFSGDPVDLALRVVEDLRTAETGHLFLRGLDAKHFIGFVLDLVREPLSLKDLKAQVMRLFGADTPYPDTDYLLPILQELDCRVQGERVLPGHATSVVAHPPLPFDDPGMPLSPDRSPEEALRDILKQASASRGFRMIMTPPERHRELGRSVAAALGATWLSFEEAFFQEHEEDLASLESAERFVGQREALREAAEATLNRLLDQHGGPGRVVVLGDTALLGLCEALDLPRLLYDETVSSQRGFWVLVLPGVIHQRQPRFNEGPALALGPVLGVTLPLLNPLPN
jgi:serine/threonine protein kinase